MTVCKYLYNANISQLTKVNFSFKAWFYFNSLPDFSYNDQLKIQEYYRDDNNGVSHNVEWTKDLFELIQKLFQSGEMRGPYGIHQVNNIE